MRAVGWGRELECCPYDQLPRRPLGSDNCFTMKTGDLLIRCLALQEGDHWVAVCLPFDLAAQARTLPEAKVALREQIASYLRDALVGVDQQHASYLLRRRAPLKYWVMYWLAGAARRILHDGHLRRFKTAVPLAPAC